MMKLNHCHITQVNQRWKCVHSKIHRTAVINRDRTVLTSQHHTTDWQPAELLNPSRQFVHNAWATIQTNSVQFSHFRTYFLLYLWFTDAPYEQLPYVVYNGKKYGQSVALASFFAREFGELSFCLFNCFSKNCSTPPLLILLTLLLLLFM